jgi:branched-chain amino acid transport system permease protein
MTLAAGDVGLLPSFTVIGLVLGGLFALAAIGLVLIYRVSGVLHFGHGAVGMFATFVAYQVAVQWHAPVVLGLLAAIATGIALGYVIERFTIRPLAGRPPLTKVVVTIGWLLVLQTLAGRIWGNTAYHRPVELVPKTGFTFPFVHVVVGYDQLTALLVAIGLAIATAAFLRWTTLGISMRAVADDPSAARLWGVNVNLVTASSWMAGSAMAAIAGVLITPMINFTPFALTLVVIDAFTAALIGRLQSLPLTVVGAILLGLAQTYPRAFFSNAGVGEVVTFALVIATLVFLFRPGAQRVRLA